MKKTKCAVMSIEELIQALEKYKGKGLYAKLIGGDWGAYESRYAYLSAVDKNGSICDDIIWFDEEEEEGEEIVP